MNMQVKTYVPGNHIVISVALFKAGINVSGYNHNHRIYSTYLIGEQSDNVNDDKGIYVAISPFYVIPELY